METNDKIHYHYHLLSVPTTSTFIKRVIITLSREINYRIQKQHVPDGI